MNDPQLDGKVAIVTGAAMGMGLATASLFAQHGARVVIADFDQTKGKAAADEICASGAEALFVACDVSDETQVSALIAGTVAHFGRLDCAVNNAATIPDDRPIADADLEQFDRIIRINLRGVMVCMKHQLRQMMSQSPVADARGAIVNIGSISSQRPRAGNAAYVASKHGVIGLTKTGSLEYAPHGIRVNAVLPGAIDTPMIQATLARSGSTEAEASASLSLLGRFGKADEVANASLWLCSDAASYVTGHSLAVDAGYLSR